MNSRAPRWIICSVRSLSAVLFVDEPFPSTPPQKKRSESGELDEDNRWTEPRCVELGPPPRWAVILRRDRKHRAVLSEFLG
jgi:hypothetical protein